MSLDKSEQSGLKNSEWGGLCLMLESEHLCVVKSQVLS